MSFFAELKRRNVFRVGIAYLIGAWLLAQIAELLLETFKAPDWTMQFIVVVLIIGLPVAVFFAWAYEMTPQGIKREKDVDRSQSITTNTGRKLDRMIMGVLTVLVAYLLVDKLVLQSPPKNSVEPEQTITAPAGPQPLIAQATEQSVAVLPFVNMSSDAEQEYFSDGITEEIINALVKIPNLSVPARTSVFGFKGQLGDVRNIGQQLSVAHVLEGSIRSQGNQVRITAQLIKVDDGFHLWSETFDRQLDDIFVVQEEIARAIAAALTGELELNIATVPNRTRNMAAYDSYLQGRTLLRKRGQRNLAQALELFRHTTTLDPEFAPAWAAMALTHSVMDITVEQSQEAIRVAQHALSLDPDNVDALDALASEFRDSWQWADAATYFEKAMAIDPQSSELLEDYAEFLGMTGRFDEYVSVAEKGYAIDPLLGPLVDSYVLALLNVGRFGRAIEVIEEWNRSASEEQMLDWWHMPIWKLTPLMANGDSMAAAEMAKQIDTERLPEPTRTAIIELLKDPDNVNARDVLRANGNKGNRLNMDVEGYTSNLVLAHTGDTDFIIDKLISDVSQLRFGNFEDIWLPIYSQVRQHKRFEEFLEIVSLPAYWDQAGWPEICQRTDTKRIECQ